MLDNVNVVCVDDDNVVFEIVVDGHEMFGRVEIW